MTPAQQGNQDHIHEPFGGIVPRLAAEAHRAEIDGVIQAALDEADVDLSEIDVVAVSSTASGSERSSWQQ